LNRILLAFLVYLLARGRFGVYKDFAVNPAKDESGSTNKPDNDYTLPALSIESLFK
jgi:hypothetical protein